MADRPPSARHRVLDAPSPFPRSSVLDKMSEPAATVGFRRRPKWHDRVAPRTSRFLRSRRGRWVLICLAGVAVIGVGLLSQGYLVSPSASKSGSDVAAGGDGPTPGSANAVSASQGTRSPSTSPAAGYVADPVAQLRGQIPDNPLNHLRGPGLHGVVIEASSSATIAVVGYLVPTALSSPYGAPHPNARSFRISLQAAGAGYLAAVFVQAGPSGASITCRVIVDGKATNVESTAGAYGRAVCLG